MHVQVKSADLKLFYGKCKIPSKQANVHTHMHCAMKSRYSVGLAQNYSWGTYVCVCMGTSIQEMGSNRFDRYLYS